MNNLQRLPDNQATYMGKPLYISSVDDRVSGVEFVSLVDRPAVNYNWMAFSAPGSAREIPQAFADSERRIITGVAMIADTPIPRIDEKTGDTYYVMFRGQDIEGIVMRFAEEGYHNKVNVMHKQKGAINGVSAVPGGVYMFESIFVDKSRGVLAPLNFADVPDKSWILSYYVKGDDVWNKLVKNGVVQGFSVEGVFNMWVKQPDKYTEINELLSLAKELESMAMNAKN